MGDRTNRILTKNKTIMEKQGRENDKTVNKLLMETFSDYDLWYINDDNDDDNKKK